MLRDWICKCTNDIRQQNSDPKHPATLSPKDQPQVCSSLFIKVRTWSVVASFCFCLRNHQPQKAINAPQIQHITFALSVSLPPASSCQQSPMRGHLGLTFILYKVFPLQHLSLDSGLNADSGWCQVNNLTLLSFWQSWFLQTIKWSLVRKHYLCYKISKTLRHLYLLKYY